MRETQSKSLIRLPNKENVWRFRWLADSFRFAWNSNFRFQNLEWSKTMRKQLVDQHDSHNLRSKSQIEESSFPKIICWSGLATGDRQSWCWTLVVKCSVEPFDFLFRNFKLEWLLKFVFSLEFFPEKSSSGFWGLFDLNKLSSNRALHFWSSKIIFEKLNFKRRTIIIDTVLTVPEIGTTYGYFRDSRHTIWLTVDNLAQYC